MTREGIQNPTGIHLKCVFSIEALVCNRVYYYLIKYTTLCSIEENFSPYVSIEELGCTRCMNNFSAAHSYPIFPS